MAAAAIPLISAAIPALAGLFGGGKQQDVKSSQDTSQKFSQAGSQTYNLNPLQQQLAAMFSQGAMDQFKQGANLAPFTSQGMQTIAGQGAANNKMISNILAQRGLSYSPAAATGLTTNAINSGNQMNSFLSGIPLLQRQLQSQGLDQLMSAFRSMPFDSNQTSSGSSDSHMSGTNVQSGNPMAGMFGGMGAGLFAPSQSGGSGSNLNDIISIFKPKPAATPTSNPYTTNGGYLYGG